jgi:hypothetical protein
MIGEMIAKIFTMVFWASPAQCQVFVCIGADHFNAWQWMLKEGQAKDLYSL